MVLVMIMFKCWNDLVVTHIRLATFVPPNTGAMIHTNRSFHGLVFNAKNRRADYVFPNGLVLNTDENSLFYLPKGSNYKVVVHSHGDGCYAINFDLLANDNVAPFTVKIENTETLLEHFKQSVALFSKASDHSDLGIRKNLYHILLLMKKELSKQYMPSKKQLLLKSALDVMNTDYAQNNLSVEKLSELCGISEVYFRRIFIEKFGISPKEYIINRRIEYAKKLLSSNQFSVQEVAEMCGYCEPCHFSREFKKRVGKSPVKYKDDWDDDLSN